MYQTPFLQQAGKKIQGIFTVLLSNMGGVPSTQGVTRGCKEQKDMGGSVPKPRGVPSKDESIGGVWGHDPWQIVETPHRHRQCVIQTTSPLAQILTQGHHDPLHCSLRPTITIMPIHHTVIFVNSRQLSKGCQRLGVQQSRIVTQELSKEPHKKHAMAEKQLSNGPTIQTSFGTGDCENIPRKPTHNNDTLIILHAIYSHRLSIQESQCQTAEGVIRNGIMMYRVWMYPHSWLSLLANMARITVCLDRLIPVIQGHNWH